MIRTSIKWFTFRYHGYYKRPKKKKIVFISALISGILKGLEDCLILAPLIMWWHQNISVKVRKTVRNFNILLSPTKVHYVTSHVELFWPRNSCDRAALCDFIYWQYSALSWTSKSIWHSAMKPGIYWIVLNITYTWGSWEFESNVSLLPNKLIL